MSQIPGYNEAHSKFFLLLFIKHITMLDVKDHNNKQGQMSPLVEGEGTLVYLAGFQVTILPV